MQRASAVSAKLVTQRYLEAEFDDDEVRRRSAARHSPPLPPRLAEPLRARRGSSLPGATGLLHGCVRKKPKPLFPAASCSSHQPVVCRTRAWAQTVTASPAWAPPGQDLEPAIQGPNVSNVLEIIQSGEFGVRNIQSLASHGRFGSRKRVAIGSDCVVRCERPLCLHAPRPTPASRGTLPCATRPFKCARICAPTAHCCAVCTHPAAACPPAI